MAINTRQKPSFAEERDLITQGYRFIAGVDEVGRGALMGPVVAAAVILPQKFRASWRKEIRDSKQLTPLARENLYDRIRSKAVATAFGIVTHHEIDTLGIDSIKYINLFISLEEIIGKDLEDIVDSIDLSSIKTVNDVVELAKELQKGYEK